MLGEFKPNGPKGMHAVSTRLGQQLSQVNQTSFGSHVIGFAWSFGVYPPGIGYTLHAFFPFERRLQEVGGAYRMAGLEHTAGCEEVSGPILPDFPSPYPKAPPVLLRYYLA